MPPDYHNPGNLRDCPWFPILMKNGVPWVPPLADHPSKFVRYYPDSADAAGNVAYVEFGNGFWVPRTRAEGVAGAAHCVALRIAMGQSLTQLISAWAPANDKNNTTQYIKNVAEWASIPNADVPLSLYIS